MSKTKKIYHGKNAKTNNYKNKRIRKSKKSMRGGDLTQEDQETLRGHQFNDAEIANLNQLNIPMNIINEAIAYYHDNSHQIIINIAKQLNENGLQNDSGNASSLLHDSDLHADNNLNVSDDNIPAIPHADNDIHDLNDSVNTTFDGEQSFDGGKRRRRRHRSKKNKMRGGRCYGNGIGSNSYDPNYSIYNTNMLKLFPYKT